jgi:hypothetical protein
MNHHYQSLIEFLHKGATNVDDVSKFLIGENTPFDTSIDTEDPLCVHLTTPSRILHNGPVMNLEIKPNAFAPAKKSFSFISKETTLRRSFFVP